MPGDPKEQRLLAAIMFTDMVGFSAVSQRDESLAVELLEEQQSIVRGAISAHDGREIKTEGDGFLLSFASALQAVRCAIAVQSALAVRNGKEPQERRFQLRIGIHVGDVLARGNDLIGDGVNVAARIEPLAEPGGICVTGPVAEQVWNKLSAQMVSMGRPKLKNIDAPVEVLRVLLPGQAAASQRAVYRPRRRSVAPAASLVTAVVLLTVGAYVMLHRPAAIKSGPAGPAGLDPRSIHSLAVLPMRNLTGDSRQLDFVAGLTDSLTTDVSHIGSIRVVSYQSARQHYGDGSKTMPQLSEELGVDAVLEGSVQRMGGRYLINVQLIHGRTDQHIWADKFEEDGGDLLRAQNRIVLAVADKIKLKLTGEEKQRFTAERKTDPLALAAYYEGRSHFVQGAEKGFLQSITDFERALSKDPKLALAWAGLADSYSSLSNWYLPPMVAMPKAEQAARKALELRPDLAEAHAAMGWVLTNFRYDRAAGEKEIQRAVQLNPNYSTGHMYYGLVLAIQGRFGDAITHLRKALELEPTSTFISFNLEWALFIAGKYEDTIRQAEHTLQMDPNYWDSHQQMGLAYFYKGDRARGLSELKLAAGKQPNSMNVTNYALALSMAGKKEEAARQLKLFLKANGKKYVCAYEVACAYEGIGDRPRALTWMQKGLNEKCDCLVWGGVEPWLEQLRKDNQFKAIQAQAGLLQ